MGDVVWETCFGKVFWHGGKEVEEMVVGAVALVAEEGCDVRGFALDFGEEEDVLWWVV